MEEGEGRRKEGRVRRRKEEKKKERKEKERREEKILDFRFYRVEFICFKCVLIKDCYGN